MKTKFVNLIQVKLNLSCIISQIVYFKMFYKFAFRGMFKPGVVNIMNYFKTKPKH